MGQYRIRYHYLDNPKDQPAWAQDPAVGLRLPPVEENQPALATMTWQRGCAGGRGGSIRNCASLVWERFVWGFLSARACSPA